MIVANTLIIQQADYEKIIQAVALNLAMTGQSASHSSAAVWTTLMRVRVCEKALSSQVGEMPGTTEDPSEHKMQNKQSHKPAVVLYARQHDQREHAHLSQSGSVSPVRAKVLVFSLLCISGPHI